MYSDQLYNTSEGKNYIVFKYKIRVRRRLFCFPSRIFPKIEYLTIDRREAIPKIMLVTKKMDPIDSAVYKYKETRHIIIYLNHESSFCNHKHKVSTTLSKHIWKLKEKISLIISNGL